MPRKQSPVVAALTRADLALLRAVARHCKTIVGSVTSRDIRHKSVAVLEALRLLRTQDVPALTRKLEVWNTLAEQSSIGSQESETTSTE